MSCYFEKIALKETKQLIDDKPNGGFWNSEFFIEFFNNKKHELCESN